MRAPSNDIIQNLYSFNTIKCGVRGNPALNVHQIRFLRHMNIKVLIVEDNPITAQDLEEIIIAMY